MDAILRFERTIMKKYVLLGDDRGCDVTAAGTESNQRRLEAGNEFGAERLAIQVADSAKWRDQILGYFAGFSKRPIPPSS